MDCKMQTQLRSQPTAESIKQDIFSLGSFLQKTLAIGVCGSLARMEDFNERSDIDIFIIVDDSTWHRNLDDEWYPIFSNLFSKYHRDVTLIIYDLTSLKKIPSWSTLGLVSEGIIIYDRLNISDVFRRIKTKAYQSGLEEVKSGAQTIWRIKPPIKPGQIVKFQLED